MCVCVHLCVCMRERVHYFVCVREREGGRGGESVCKSQCKFLVNLMIAQEMVKAIHSLRVNLRLAGKLTTVEPPIMDTPRYGQPPYNGQATCPRLTLP